ncbi:GNAT family N-acetyltransferase [Salinicoccus sp. ID82-1]|uniref:GNAT family N-acetyltransferase n=1 Tax=Salinicoccus cyprini TaxID=2493691 RepID=A0A558AU68_9STAP|nr:MULTISPECIES: GNAT family N-acetyltransferase [Salinicoccus]MCG1010698.1 GNAT family N-acetyltransferase [Salinicoccus sp. ID82-1]TVT27801.1 GNAT family N-acetyltransferase [Salinicoccus cyprini]
MLNMSRDRDIAYSDIKQLYMGSGDTPYENRLDALHEAIIRSDYLVTAWDGEMLVGLLRSSGDMQFTQVIADFLVHPEHHTKGIASKLMNAYIKDTADVEKIYLFMDDGLASAFTRNWLVHKGFRIIKDGEDLCIYLKRNLVS